ncbi:MAG: serine hydrolase, partial [Chloroflexota bacterium]
VRRRVANGGVPCHGLDLADGHPVRPPRQRLLDPLGLTASWYQAAEPPRAPGTTAYRMLRVKGAWQWRVAAPASDIMPFRSVVTAAGGAGSIAATALDAARWMRAYATGGVVSQAMLALMIADVSVTAADGATIPYGLGVQAVLVGGRPALGHSGRFLGFRNVARYLTDSGITIAVLTNQGVVDPRRIEESLMDIVLPPPTPTPTPTPSPSGSPGATGSPSSSGSSGA